MKSLKGKIQNLKQNISKGKSLKLIMLFFGTILAALVVSLICESFNSYVKDDASGVSKEVELNLVYAYQNAQWNSAIEKSIQNFEKKYPNIKINYEVNYEHKVYEDILTKKIATDTLGDIVQLKSPQAYAESGALAELPKSLTKSVTYNYNENGKVYGIGAVEATSGIIYNKALFHELGLSVPKTYSDFLKICKVLKQNGITPIGVAGRDLWHMEYWVNHFFRMDVLIKDKNWLSECEAGKVSWTDAEPTAMLTNLSDLFGNGFVNGNWLATTDSSLSYKMSEEEIAMIYTGPWTSSDIQKLNKNIKLGWFYLPNEEGQTDIGDNKDTFWSVTAECADDKQKYAAALEFLKFFYSSSNYKQICKTTSTFPVTKTKVDYEKTAIQAEISTSFNKAKKRETAYIGDDNTPQDFEKGMLLIVEKALSGQYDTDRAMKKIEILWKQCLSQEEDE